MNTKPGSSHDRTGPYGVTEDTVFACILVVDNKFTPLNYDDTFAYGCLHGIPIPFPSRLDTTFTPEEERQVLMEIFNKTDGGNWKNNIHWGNSSVSHCLWYGITCEHTSRYVISIFLESNNLAGTFPNDLWKLRNLQAVSIAYNNNLQGSVGDILSPNMSTLLRIHFSFNKFSGKIPGELLVQLRSLAKIHLCCQMGEGLFGNIPDDIGNLTELQVLSLGGNKLNGVIPKSIAKLKKLWFLDLDTASSLQGGFENLMNLSSLQYMHLSLSGLNGTLPKEFGSYFPAMIECLLPGNNFSGNIPPSFGKMKNLLHLNLAYNDFSGKIPKSIGAIPKLKIADFRENKLTSLEEGTQFKSQLLKMLILSGNKKLNVSFGTLIEAVEPVYQTLLILNVSECHIHGVITDKLWNFQSLISVDLSNNKLSGKLPPPPNNTVTMSLLHLDVSGNNISGQIPEQFAMLLALEVLDVSNNPQMRKADESGILPNYMKVDPKTLAQQKLSDNFKCPNARLSYNNGLVILDPNYYLYRLCICDVGYYGSGKTCLPCMENGVCKDQMLPAQHMVMKVGYWPSSRDQSVTHLVQCSRALGASSRASTSCNPTGLCKCRVQWLKQGNKSTIEPSTVCDKKCLCIKGSKDRFCSLCEDGYYKQGILCYACPKARTSVYILVALVVLTMVLLTLAFVVFYEKKRFLSIVFVFSQIILFAVLAMLRIIPGWLLELNVIALFVGLAGRGKTARGILKISVFYFQTLDALISNTDAWPYYVLAAQRYIGNVFNLHFSGLACEIPSLFTPLGELLFLILLPVVCILVIWLYYCLSYAVLWFRNSLDRRFSLRNSCLQLSIVSLNLTYFPVVKKTASVLAPCGEDNNHHFLLEAPWLECEGGVYTTLQVFGGLALVLYVIGVPFGVFLPLLLRKARNRENLAVEDQETLDSWLGSIYLPYKKKFRSYFEVLFLMRRMLIAFSLSFIPQASPFQTIAICVVLLASLCFQLLFKPFSDSYQNLSLENSAETVVLLSLHFCFMNIRYAALNQESSEPIVWMLVVLNLVVICGLIISIILLLGRAHVQRTPSRAPQNEGGEEHETVTAWQADAPLIANKP